MQENIKNKYLEEKLKNFENISNDFNYYDILKEIEINEKIKSTCNENIQNSEKLDKLNKLLENI